MTLGLAPKGPQAGTYLFGITGHQYVPDLVWDHVHLELTTRYPDMGGLSGISCLAAGADQVLATWVIDNGGTLATVVPSADYTTTFEEPATRATYEDLLARSHEVVRLDFTEPGEQAYLAAGHYVVDHCHTLLAVWDGQPARGPGGTADVVAYAHRVGRPIVVLWPNSARRPE